MNISEWESELRAADVAPEGFTSLELSTELEISRSRVRSMIRDLILAGRVCMAGTRDEVRIDGQSYRAPVYQLVKRRKSGAKS